MDGFVNQVSFIIIGSSSTTTAITSIHCLCLAHILSNSIWTVSCKFLTPYEEGICLFTYSYTD